MKKLIPVLVALILIVIIGYFTFKDFFEETVAGSNYSEEKVNMADFYGVREGSSEFAILLNDEKLDQKGKVSDGKSYLKLDLITDKLNDIFYMDWRKEELLYTLPTEIRRVKLGTTVEQRGEETKDMGYVIAFREGEDVYVALDYVQRYTNLAVLNDAYHVDIQNVWGKAVAATLSKDSALRISGAPEGAIVKEVTQGSQIRIMGKGEEWSKVKTLDGYMGYIENKVLKDEREIEEPPVASYKQPEYTNITMPGKVSLGWHSIGGTGGNDTFDSMVSATKGLNVIAPTWFSISDAEGNIQNFGSKNYVKKAHDKGLQVWAVLDDFNYNNANSAGIQVYDLLENSDSRRRLIDNTVKAVKDLGADGINLDFERVTADCDAHFAQFLRELSVECRLNKLVFSVDSYVPFAFNGYYRRDVQGQVADYVIIMGYDEHWHGSKDPGSVASIDFVSNGIDKTLAQVPKEKVVNAVPFYSILWKIDGAEVTDEYITLGNVKDFLSRSGQQLTWDEETSQEYGEWTSGTAIYKFWAETEQSLAIKLNVMKSKDIAGVAVWQISYGSPEAWEMIQAYANQ